MAKVVSILESIFFKSLCIKQPTHPIAIAVRALLMHTKMCKVTLFYSTEMKGLEEKNQGSSTSASTVQLPQSHEKTW